MHDKENHGKRCRASKRRRPNTIRRKTSQGIPNAHSTNNLQRRREANNEDAGDVLRVATVLSADARWKPELTVNLLVLGGPPPHPVDVELIGNVPVGDLKVLNLDVAHFEALRRKSRGASVSSLAL